MTGASLMTALAALIVGLPLLVLLALALLTLYRLSLKRHPFTNCRRCKGTGERRSRLFAHSFGYCPDCTGTGYKPRIGVRLLNIR